MLKSNYFSAAAAGALCAVMLTGSASAKDFNIPGGDLKTVLDSYAAQAGVPLIYSGVTVKGTHSNGAKGDLSADAALSHILENTGFGILHESGAIAIVRTTSRGADEMIPVKIAAAPA